MSSLVILFLLGTLLTVAMARSLKPSSPSQTTEEQPIGFIYKPALGPFNYTLHEDQNRPHVTIYKDGFR